MPSTYRALPAPPAVELLAQLDLIGPEAYDPIWDDVRDHCHYDRNGEPITMRAWTALFGLGISYRQIAYTEVGPYHVSTVWMGLDHGFNYSDDPDYKPWIFETMVFANETSYKPEWETELDGEPITFGGFHYHEDFDQRRYNSEQAALDDHETLVEEIALLVAANPDWKPEGEGYPPEDTTG